MISILEPSFSNSDAAGIGLVMFFIAIGAASIAITMFFVIGIAFLINRNNSYRIPVIIGLVLLVISGISLLLTAVLCDWIR